MITITQKTINLQAEGSYEDITIHGSAEINEKQINVISGSIFRENNQVGNFSMGSYLSVMLDDKDNANLMSSVSEAITTFCSELKTELDTDRI